ncbi:MAG: hypothetical protein M1828_002599 [Chrysothrix sp. TS-e1954]|nr:MAG: hypothetical protein M1828_002599 [Chrysothrix sp. TS-e1954]
METQDPVPAPSLPDYVLGPNAVLKDVDVAWRYGTAPDYTKTRSYWEKTKVSNHEAGSLPSLVENLVKNWEVEASFKTRLSDWRTVDHSKYTFAINGGSPQSAEHMLKVGTYNAIIDKPNEYYSPRHSDFASSHKTFKRMMPTFAWEVLEVYSGPPTVAFKWRHWGVMEKDYVGFNATGEKVSVKGHGGPIDIQGVTTATVDESLRVQRLETWFDPLEMFRQIAPKGIVNKEIVDAKDGALDRASSAEAQIEKTTSDMARLDETGAMLNGSMSTESGSPAGYPSQETDHEASSEKSVSSMYLDRGADQSHSGGATSPSSSIRTRPTSKKQGTKSFTGGAPVASGSAAADVTNTPMEINDVPEASAHTHQLKSFEAHAAHADSEQAKSTHEEMSTITPMECPFLNGE